MRARAIAVGLLPLTLTPGSLRAQDLEVAVHGLLATHLEETDVRTRRSSGLGVAGVAVLRLRRLRVEGRFVRLAFDPSEGFFNDYDLTQVEARVALRAIRFVEPELGLTRRYITPTAIRPDVGYLTIGLRSERELAPSITVWARGAYVFLTRFSSGGDSPLAFKVGLGTVIGRWRGRWSAVIEYEFERLDREGGPVESPTLLSVAQAGVAFGF